MLCAGARARSAGAKLMIVHGGAPRGSREPSRAAMMAGMSRYFCHDHPDVYSIETSLVAARPGAVALAQSPYHPGGGGQLPDRGRLAWEAGEARITGFEIVDGVVWHLLDRAVEPS